MSSLEISQLPSGTAQASDITVIARPPFGANSNFKVTAQSIADLAPEPTLPEFQVNGTDTADQTLLDFVDTASVTWANIGGQVRATAVGGVSLSRATVTVSSAQLKSNLQTTPVQLIPAQGAGTVIIPVSITMNLVAGGTPYDNTNGVELIIGYNDLVDFQDVRFTPIVQVPSSMGFINNTVNSLLTSYYEIAPNPLDSAGIINRDVCLSAYNPSGLITAGTGTVVVSILYYVLTGAV